MTKTKKLSKDTKDKILDLSKSRINQSAISKQLDEVDQLLEH